MVGIVWDAEADRKILLAVLKEPNVTASMDWDALAAELSSDAGTCTVGALKKHISRLRVAAQKGNADGEASAVPKTPAAKGKGTIGSGDGSTTKVPATKGKGKARKRPVADSDSDDEPTPLAKKKKSAGNSATEEVKVKAEVVEEV